MLDMHCHILPGVDDGARDMRETQLMLAAARGAGIDRIVCTPHVREPYFHGAEEFEAMWQAFYALEGPAREMGIELSMGFEVSHRKLTELGLEWAEALHADGSSELLLEFSVGASPERFAVYERTIFELQGMGYDIIIAHPERYIAIQKDLGIAEELVRMGCRLQLSADFIEGGRFGRERRPAIALLDAGFVSFIASDAHVPSHYALFARAHQRYGSLLDAGGGRGTL